MNLTDEVVAVASKALRIPLQPEACMENTPQWDSLSYIQIVSALEGHFQVTFSRSELGLLHSIPSICQVLQDRSQRP